jgi:hypothetical protein
MSRHNQEAFMIQSHLGKETVQLQKQLDSLATDFTRWRAQRFHRRAAVPQPLRERAVTLALASSRVRVSKALSISYTMLNTWSPKLQAQATRCRRAVSPTSKSSPASAPTFVPLEQAVADTDTAVPAFTVSTSSGQRLTIEGACSAAQISALVLALCATAAA